MIELGKGQGNYKIHNDNMSNIHLAKNVVFNAKTKHTQLRYHFISSLLENNQLSLVKIHTI